MDYRIYRSKHELKSTGYIEVAPGKYSGTHWQEGSLFVWEDAFRMAEGILAKHLTSYDHFSMNDVPKDIGQRVTPEWRRVAARLEEMAADEATGAFNLIASYGGRHDTEVISHRTAIARMLTELADACDEFYSRGDWVCILGI